MSRTLFDEVSLLPATGPAAAEAGPAPPRAGGGAEWDAPPGGRRRPEPTAGLSFCVLGSGSGGNSSVVRYGGQAVLIDAGFGPVTIARRLRQAGVELQAVRAVVLTHLDQDHFRPNLVATLLGWGIAVHVHRWHLPQLLALPGAGELDGRGLVRPFAGEPFAPVEALRFVPVPLPHDTKGTSGFVVRGGDGRGCLGYATDLGHVPPALIEHFSAAGGVEVLALESNYDPELQRCSSRPAFLKRRIMGGHGHLSNQQAFEAVRTIAERCAAGLPRHVVLLHRSAQCNQPERVRQVFDRDPALSGRVVLAEQRRRSRWFAVGATSPAARAQMRLTAAAGA